MSWMEMIADRFDRKVNVLVLIQHIIETLGLFKALYVLLLGRPIQIKWT